METQGKLVNVTRDIISGRLNITFQIATEPIDDINKLAKLDTLDIKAVKYRKKRSLDANAYYWQLLTQMAEVLSISKPRAHNMMLRKYGQREYIDGKLVTIPIPDTESAENTALEAETYHIKPTSQVRVGKDETVYRTYVMLRGSSDYNTKEMSELINGLVAECKELGIETLPPEELERMMKAWKP